MGQGLKSEQGPWLVSETLEEEEERPPLSFAPSASATMKRGRDFCCGLFWDYQLDREKQLDRGGRYRGHDREGEGGRGGGGRHIVQAQEEGERGRGGGQRLGQQRHSLPGLLKLRGRAVPSLL